MSVDGNPPHKWIRSFKVLKKIKKKKVSTDLNYFKNKFYLRINSIFNKIYLLAFTEILYIQRVKKTVSDNL